jgi:hypothetical protein
VFNLWLKKNLSRGKELVVAVDLVGYETTKQEATDDHAQISVPS